MRDGSALLSSLAVVIGVGALTAVSLQIQTARLSRLQTENDKKRAFYLAEAGLAEALLSLQEEGTGNIGTEESPAGFGDGFLFTETVEDEFGLLHLDAYGIQGVARERLSAVVQKEFKPLAREGFYGKDMLIVNSGVFTSTDTTAYDAYKAQIEAAKAAAGLTDAICSADGLPILPEDVSPRLASDGIITILGGIGPLFTELLADVRPGPGASFLLPIGARVAGLTAPRPERAALPRIQAPIVPAQPNLVVPRGTSQSITSSGEYALIQINNNGTLYLTGPLSLVVDQWTHDGAVVVDGSAGPVDLFVRNGFALSNQGSFINVGAQASHLRIQVLAQDAQPLVAGAVQFETNQPFIGQIYAPRANVVLPTGSNVKGAIAAWTLQVGIRSRLEHDPMLLVHGLGKDVMTQVSWGVEVVPTEIADPVAYDPARDYAALAIVPPAPAISHRPLAEVVRYLSAETGLIVTLRGRLADLPPRKVAAVLDTVLPADPRFADVKHPGGRVDHDIDDDEHSDEP
jgi:hypothetical protein